jgi:hypothetical protein
LELAKDIFFFIGSALGIVAFLRTLFEPAFADNRQKWEALKERLREEDLINLQSQVYIRRRVQDELLLSVDLFVRDIEQDAEYMRFGFPFRRLFEEHKNGLVDNFRQLIEHVQVPYWEHDFVGDGDERRGEWSFDKRYFFDELPAVYRERNPEGPRLDPHQAYVDHLDEASDAVDWMRVHYRAIGVLANLHMFEALFARRKVSTGSTLPETR